METHEVRLISFRLIFVLYLLFLFSFKIHSNGDFHWTSEEQGLLLGAFYYGYVISQIPGGYWAEKFGAKWVYGPGVLIPGILTLLTPLAAYHSLTMIVAVRVLEGLVCGATGPAMSAMSAKWYPSNERSSLCSYANSGKDTKIRNYCI